MDAGEKDGSAKLARPFDSAHAISVRQDNVEFPISYGRAMKSMGSPPFVAAVARRNEVVRRIVGRVEIKMVGDKCAACKSATWHPGYGHAAPTARMRSGADPVVENDSGGSHDAARWGYGMPWGSNQSVRNSFAPISMTVGTRNRAIGVQPMAPRSSGEVSAAEGACALVVDHAWSIAIRKDD